MLHLVFLYLTAYQWADDSVMIGKLHKELTTLLDEIQQRNFILLEWRIFLAEAIIPSTYYVWLMESFLQHFNAVEQIFLLKKEDYHEA